MGYGNGGIPRSGKACVVGHASWDYAQAINNMAAEALFDALYVMNIPAISQKEHDREIRKLERDLCKEHSAPQNKQPKKEP